VREREWLSGGPRVSAPNSRNWAARKIRATWAEVVWAHPQFILFSFFFLFLFFSFQIQLYLNLNSNPVANLSLNYIVQLRY
jgi:hypothetical protein